MPVEVISDGIYAHWNIRSTLELDYFQHNWQDLGFLFKEPDKAEKIKR